MDKESLEVIRDDVISRIRAIVFERYGEFIPTSLIDGNSQSEAAVKVLERIESFKADEDLLDLFEVFHKIVIGNYGNCLLCRRAIDLGKLRSNVLAKFCDECERILSPVHNAQLVEYH